MPKNWNKTVSIQEAKAAYVVGDDLDAYCFLYEGDRVRPVRITASGNIVILPPYVAPVTLDTKTGRVVDSLIANIVPVQSGSGDPTPDNVRPISGWTGINVQRTEKNLLNPSAYDFQTVTRNGLTYTVQDDGTIHVTGTATATGGPSLASKISLPNGTYTYLSESSYNVHCAYRGQYVSNGSTFALPNPFTVDNTFGVYINLFCKNIGTYDLTVHPQIEVGSTATDYEPYQGNTYSVNWETKAGTVYGGTVDVTGGELTITDAMIASYAGEMLPSTWISDRDVYAEGTTPTTGAQVVYKLATPLTYQLTPTEVTLLPGENNIFADTGPITLTYVETQEV